jgi:hypothetical protein
VQQAANALNYRPASMLVACAAAISAAARSG